VRDWGALVRERLGGLELTPAQEEEIVAELAGHLEDLYEGRRAQGLGESQAFEAVGRALDEVANWRRLARKIHRAKREEENMNNRTKSLWLPGLVSLAAANAFLMILQRAGLQPHFIWLRSGPALMLYLRWLIALPLFGALSTYLSRRAGGQPLARLAAGLFPSIILLGLFCLLLVGGLIVDRQVRGTLTLIGFATGVGNWVLLPGAALLLGALPFLKAPKLRQS
jgi:hypothetical protein